MTDGPRIPPVPREEWTDAVRAVFALSKLPDAWENGSRSNLINTLANHPERAKPLLTYGYGLLNHSDLPDRPRELVTLRIAWICQSDYEWLSHVPPAQAAGMTDAEIAAIKVGPDDPIWTGTDLAILRAIEQFQATARVDDATWSVLAAAFDRRALMDLVFTMGYYMMLSWAINSFGVELDPFHEDGVRAWMANQTMRDAQGA